MKTEVQRLQNSQIKITVTVPAEKVEEAFVKAVSEAAKNIEVKGFRKGKAPRAEVEKKLNQSELNGRVINLLLPASYSEAVEKEGIKPICDPRVEIKKFSRGNELIFAAETAEAPEVEFGKWKKALRDLGKKASIAVAGTLTEAKTKASSKEEKKRITSAEVLEALRKEAKVEVPEMLIEDEVSRMLTRLNDRLATLGLTPEEYLKNRGQTREMLRQQYRNTAREVMETEFILAKLGNDLQIEVEEEEIEKVIAAAPEEETRKSLKEAANRAYIKAVLRKNKTIERLMKIAESASWGLKIFWTAKLKIVNS